MIQTIKTKTDQEVMATQDDLEMMKRPHLWPRGVAITLTRVVDSKTEYGFLTIANLGVVIKANLFTVHYKNTDLATLPQEDYGSAEGVFAAGWRVD